MRFTFAILSLALTACTSEEPAELRERTDSTSTIPHPDYVAIVEGDGFRGALFTRDSVTMAGPRGEHVIPVAPYGSTFRLSSASEIASFEATIRHHWDWLMDGGMDDPPWQPNTSNRLSGFLRQYVGYTDSTGQRGLWVNFFPAGLGDVPALPGAPLSSYPAWVTEPLIFSDGGDLFFRVWYSVDRDSVTAVLFNGV